MSQQAQAGDSIVLEEEIDPNYEPTDGEVIEYAKWLGMDLDEDKELVWIAREGLKAPLPENWKPCKTLDTKEIYYFNFANGESTWDHPCDAYYRNLYEEEKKRRFARMQSASGRDDGQNRRMKEPSSPVHDEDMPRKNNSFKSPGFKSNDKMQQDHNDMSNRNSPKNGGFGASGPTRNANARMAPVAASVDTAYAYKGYTSGDSRRRGNTPGSTRSNDGGGFSRSVEDSYDSRASASSHSRYNNNSNSRNAMSRQYNDTDNSDDTGDYDADGVYRGHYQYGYGQKSTSSLDEKARYEKLARDARRRHEERLRDLEHNLDVEFEEDSRKTRSSYEKRRKQQSMNYEDELSKMQVVHQNNLDAVMKKHANDLNDVHMRNEREMDLLDKEIRQKRANFEAQLRELEQSERNSERDASQTNESLRISQRELELQVASLNDECEQLETQKINQTREVDVLRGAKRNEENALMTLKLQADELRQLVSTLQNDKKSLQADLDALGRAESLKTEKVSTLEAEIVELDESIKLKELEVSREIDSRNEEMNSAIRVLEISKSEFEEQIRILESRKKLLESTADELEATINDLNQQLSEVGTDIASINLAEQRATVDEIREEVLRIVSFQNASENEKIHSQIDSVTSELEHERRMNEKMSENLHQQRNSYTKMIHEMREAEMHNLKQLQAERSKYVALVSKLTDKDEDMKRQCAQMEELGREHSNLQNVLEELKSRLDKEHGEEEHGLNLGSVKQITILQGQLDKVRDQLEVKSIECNTLQKEIRDLRSENKDIVNKQRSLLDSIDAEKEIAWTSRFRELENERATLESALREAERTVNHNKELHQRELNSKGREVEELKQKLNDYPKNNNLGGGSDSGYVMELEQKMKSYEDNISQMQSQVEVLKEENQRMEREKEQSEASIDRMLERFHTEINHANESMQSAESKLEESEREFALRLENQAGLLKRAEENSRAMEHELNSLKERHLTLQNDNESLVRKLEHVDKARKSDAHFEKRMDVLQREKMETDALLEQSQEKVIEYTREIGRLKREFQSLTREYTLKEEQVMTDVHNLTLERDSVSVENSKLKLEIQRLKSATPVQVGIENDQHVLEEMKTRETQLSQANDSLEREVAELRLKVERFRVSNERSSKSENASEPSNVERPDKISIRVGNGVLNKGSNRIDAFLDARYASEKEILERAGEMIEKQGVELQRQKQELLAEASASSRSTQSQLAVQIGTLFQSQVAFVDNMTMELQHKSDTLGEIGDILDHLHDLAMQLRGAPEDEGLRRKFEVAFEEYSNLKFRNPYLPQMRVESPTSIVESLHIGGTPSPYQNAWHTATLYNPTISPSISYHGSPQGYFRGQTQPTSFSDYAAMSPQLMRQFSNHVANGHSPNQTISHLEWPSPRGYDPNLLDPNDRVDPLHSPASMNGRLSGKNAKYLHK